MARAVHVCDPGHPSAGPDPDRYNAEQLKEKCSRRSCKCTREEHWWGEGPCACGNCDYFEAKRKGRREQSTASEGNGTVGTD
jgi:hypothetical protein